MERVRQQDLQGLLSYLHEIYAYRDLDSFAADIVSTLPKIVPSELTCYSEVDSHSRKIIPVKESASVIAEARQALGQHIHEHPIIHHYQLTKDGPSF